MSKDFTSTINLKGPPENVLTMLQTDSYWRMRLIGATSGNFKIDHLGQRFIVTLTRADDVAGELPKVIANAVGSLLEITEIQTWPISLDSSQLASGKIEIRVNGKPAKLNATATLSPSRSGSRITFSGTLKVDIPIIGGQIENFIIKYIVDAFREIETGGNEWLKEN